MWVSGLRGSFPTHWKDGEHLQTPTAYDAPHSHLASGHRGQVTWGPPGIPSLWGAFQAFHVIVNQAAPQETQVTGIKAGTTTAVCLLHSIVQMLTQLLSQEWGTKPHMS